MPTLSASGCEIHYAVHDLTAPWIDDKQFIVFHHGLGASSGTWAGWFPALADRLRIVSFDMRGHGRSSHPSADTALSLDVLADDIFRVADAAGAQNFHLVGESIGGTVALLAALEHPERVRTLTISNGAHIGGSIQSIDDWKQIIDTRGMQGWSEHMMRGRFFDGAIDTAMWRWYEREQAAVSPDFVLRAVRLLAGADLSARLSALRVPTLLLHGDSSPFIPVAVMADLRARLPDARLQVFAHAKHGLPFSHAQACAQTLRRFLDDVSPVSKG
jgi:pimeloyl-ACP methyl ester carboxylesterase